MNTNFTYDNKDYYSILEYLKSQAVLFSNGAWTDFSDADIGTVLLKLMAMLADTSNYQLEKSVSELYLGTTVERVNAIALCKLIGYEPRHYMSAHVSIDLFSNVDIETLVIPRFTVFTNKASSVQYYTLEDFNFNGMAGVVEAYEGRLVSLTYQYADIDNTGKIYLPDYAVGTNTIIIEQGGLKFEHIDNALFGENNACFSVHLNSDNVLYVQFPPYWKNFITNSSFNVYYLLSSGESGRVGANILDGVLSIENNILTAENNEASVGGYNPESVEEIRLSAPLYATTMDTLVTLEDIDGLAEQQEGIADVVALDYNYPSTGLIQPSENNYTKNDAYKVNVYVLPESSDSIYEPGETVTKTYIEPVATSSNLENRKLLFNFPVNLYGMLEDTNTNILEYRTVEGLLYYTLGLLKDSNNNICRLTWTNIFDNTQVVLYQSNSSTVSVNLTELQLTGVYGAVTLTDVQTTNIVGNYIQSSYTETLPVFTTEMQGLANYISDRKLSSIEINYKDVNYVKPIITLKVYMDQNDLRFDTTASSVREYIVELYARKSGSIGKSIFRSNLSSNILDAFPYIKYVEILSMTGEVGGMLQAGDFDFLDILPENINITMENYTE